MLTISKPLSASQARTYHAREFASEKQNYWSRDQQGHSEWQGRLAGQWKLSGAVEAEHFARLSEGQHPRTEEQLVRHRVSRTYAGKFGKEVTSTEHRAGWDATFSAPKSVSLTALVGGDGALAMPFNGGHFATLYLSPKDYHRIHMPCAGTLRRMIHVPGELFSVNPATARGVPGLFARNERVICVFDGEPGPWALVLVGATIVGSMATVWHGVVNPPRPGKVRDWRYDDAAPRLAQGEEMGRFLLGSTVVLLFPPGPLSFNPTWAPGREIRMGEAMAARA